MNQQKRTKLLHWGMIWCCLCIAAAWGFYAPPVHAQSTVPDAETTIPSASEGNAVFLPIVSNGTESTSTPAPVDFPPDPSSGNPCPEGQFLDLVDNVCRTLDVPQYGFDWSRFQTDRDESRVVNAECNEESLEDALEQAQGGGTVQLPACTFAVGRINMPSNVVLQGAGRDQTRILGNNCSDDASAKRVFLIDGQENVVLRDMTLDAESQNCVMISVERSENILIERVAVLNGRLSGIKFLKGVRNITVRYAEMANHATYHGLDSKDCSTGEDLSECPESEWTRSYAVYSNVMHGSTQHGMNIHATHGEIAGNLSFNNGYGGKLYDGQCVWVHHNSYFDNEGWGMFIAPTLDIDARVPHDLYFYKNQFRNIEPDTWSWGITPFAGAGFEHPIEDHTNVYLIDNVLEGRVKTDGVPVNICPGTTEATLDIDSQQPGAADVCSLAAYPSMGGTALPYSACALP